MYKERNILSIPTFVLTSVSCCTLLPSLVCGWYYVKYTNKNVIEDFLFYATKIYQKSSYNDIKISLSWSDFALKNTHSIINTSLAFSTIGLFFGVVSLLAFVPKFKEYMTISRKRMPVISRVGILLMFISTIISVSVLSGITNAFDKDLKSFNNNSNQDGSISSELGKSFFYCIDSCDKKWHGEVNNSNDGSSTKFGPGAGFILACCSLLPQFLAIPLVILGTIVPII